ncbi:MAG: hypothetical protein QM477_00160 [Planctomycetota bacterium]
MVDGSGNTPGASLSITDGIAALGPNDTVIDVIGMSDPNGNPLGYSQRPLTGSPQTAEIFPIGVPPGITIRQSGSVPVYVWDAVGGIGLNLFELDFSLTGPALTRFTGISMMGGAVAVEARSLAAFSELDVLIKNCRFSGQTIATIANAEGGATIRFGVQNCTIADSTITTSADPPILRAPSTGFEFVARGSSAGLLPSTTIGRIEDLAVVGDFAVMAPADPRVGFNDLMIPTTKLVHVFVEGFENLREYGNAPTSYVPIPIPTVNVDILGGAWRGGDLASPGSGGWDIAAYAESQGGGTASNPHDYQCGYTVSMAGTSISNFRTDGIYGSAFNHSRGNINLLGGTSVTNTGFGATVETENSGVHVFALESYLGLQAAGCNFSDNLGNGVYANTGGNLIVNLPDILQIAPQGLYVGITKSEIHNNGANGVYLRNEGFQPGFIGERFTKILQGHSTSMTMAGALRCQTVKGE